MVLKTSPYKSRKGDHSIRIIYDQEMIQTFFLDSANPAFSKRVCIGSPKRGIDDMKAFRLENSIKDLAERVVIVVDQETQERFPFIEFPHQLSGLLCD
jgi:hypothetical protein